MKNSPSLNKLTDLMRSLTQAQKRDFKKYVKFWGTKKERKYIALFDALQKFITAGKDDKELAEYLQNRKKPVGEPEEIVSAATYLFRKIVESMRSTPEAMPYSNRLNALLQDIGFLYSKNLFSHAQALVKEALQTARDLDKPACELELHFWNRRLTTAQAVPNNLQTLAEWLETQHSLSARLTEILHYEALAAELRISFLKKEKLPESTENRVKDLLEGLKDGLDERLSIRVRINLFAALSHYFDLQYGLSSGKTTSGLVKKSTMEKSVFFQGKALDVFYQNKIFAEEEEVLFSNILGDYINRCIRSEQTELVEQLEKELKGSKNELMKYRLIAFSRLQHYLKINDFRQARSYFETNKVAEGIEKYKYRMPENRLLALRFTAGQIYYSLDDYDRAGDWFGQVARMRLEVRPDAVIVCKVLEMICLWEYGAFKNDSDPARPVKNLRRSFRRARVLDKFLEKTLDAAEEVFRHPRALNRSDFSARLAELKKTFDEDKTKALYSTVLAWFDAKLHRTPLSREIVRY